MEFTITVKFFFTNCGLSSACARFVFSVQIVAPIRIAHTQIRALRSLCRGRFKIHHRCVTINGSGNRGTCERDGVSHERDRTEIVELLAVQVLFDETVAHGEGTQNSDRWLNRLSGKRTYTLTQSSRAACSAPAMRGEHPNGCRAGPFSKAFWTAVASPKLELDFETGFSFSRIFSFFLFYFLFFLLTCTTISAHISMYICMYNRNKVFQLARKKKTFFLYPD